MTEPTKTAGREVADLIRATELTIYDEIERTSNLFFDVHTLQDHLRQELYGMNLDYKNRTRSKIGKQAVCEAMGYPIPRSFRRVRPRIPGQDLDVYIQMNNNLQVWNEEVEPSRRYAVIRVDDSGIVTTVRVVTGESLAQLDKTGTLTQKYQARRRPGRQGSVLVSNQDTESFVRILNPVEEVPNGVLSSLHPSEPPTVGSVLSIRTIYERAKNLVGTRFPDPGKNQERNRGEILHRLICSALGLGSYSDHGQFPDVLCQAIEVKLQTSPTIDLGLVSPDSVNSVEQISSEIQHRDMRYVIAYGETIDEDILVDSIVVTTGEGFFSEFQRFEGRVINKKLQIRLPDGFFGETE